MSSSSSESEEESRLLKEGDTFANVEDAKEAVKEFGSAVFADFRVDTNNKYSLRFFCKHGGRKKDKTGTGARKKQHYNHMDCKASISLYKSQKDGSITCTKINSEHTHPVSKAIFDHNNVELTQTELDLCANLKNGNCKPSQIKKVLLEKFNKDITIQKLKNVMKNIPANPLDDDEVNFQDFFTNFEMEGGEVDWLEDPDKSVRCMTFASKKMKSAFQSSDPPLIQLDTTFEIEESRYKLMAAVYLNPTTNKSEVAFMALLCDETNDTVEFALKKFKQICLRGTLIFVVDKDFGQLGVLSSVFPQARVLLCVFHAIKFIRTLLASAPELKEKKEELLDQFRAVLYSNTEEVFNEEDKKFVKACGDVTVKTGKNQDVLAEYYIRNWRSCKEMWVKCYRKNLPCLGDNTSNRVERFFWTLKKAFQDTFMSLPKTMKAAIYLVKFADQRLQEKYIFTQNKVLIIYDEDPQIRENNQVASKLLNDRGCVVFHAAQTRLKDVFDKLSVVDDEVIEKFSRGASRAYQTTLSSCSCSFVSNHQSPCAHILFLRAEKAEEIFSPDLFHPRYLRASSSFTDVSNLGDNIPEDPNQDGSFDEEDTIEEEVVLNDKQKYNLVTPILLRIGNLISCHPTKKFLQYLDGLNELEKRIRRGQNFMLQINKIVAEAEDEDGDYEDVEEDDDKEDDEVGSQVLTDLVESNVSQAEGHNRNNLIVDVENNAGPVLQEVRDKFWDEDLGNVSQDTVRQDDHEEELDDMEIASGSGTGKSKFAGIVFKHGLKTKGRPKKRSKQFTFNKCAADRKVKKQTKKSVKKKKKTQLINSDSSFEDTENAEDLKLDDEEDAELDEEIEMDEDSEIDFNV